jgi:hypothetical protein
MTSLRWSGDSEGIRFTLSMRNTPKPFAEWATAAAPSELGAVGVLVALVENEQARAEVDRVLVPQGAVAGLSEREAEALCLPAAVPFSLEIKHQGTLDQREFRFRYGWARGNGQPVMGASRTGALLRAGSAHYRIPEPFFALVEAMDDFNMAPPPSLEERFLAWGRIYELLEDQPRAEVRPDRYLSETRVTRAMRFTLDLGGTWESPEFVPILLGRPRIADEDEPEEDPTNLLAPHYQDAFARRFQGFDDALPRYVLGDGHYLVLEEGLRGALSVVRRMQQANPDMRRAFARDPRPYLASAVGAEQAEVLFVETHGYSERVLGIGLWQPKVLPWVKQAATESWLPPEELGLLVGSTRIEVPAERLPELRKQLVEAIERGQPQVQWEDATLPANPETLAAVDHLIGRARPIEPREPSSPTESTERQPTVLVIQDNLAGLDYQVTRASPRAGDIQDGPESLRTSPKPHQVEGLRWLQEHWISGSRGALLADDMGLGKTLQALAFLAWLRQGMSKGRIEPLPFLVVAPTGLLKNWEQECDQHLAPPRLGDLFRAWGTELRRWRTGNGRDIDTGEPALEFPPSLAAGWAVTTYETLRDYQHSFAAVRFAAVVYDEAQKIKTPGSLMTEAAKAMNADFTLVMTGTPIENRLSDLWCLVDTAQPGLLEDLRGFSQHYERNPKSRDLEQLNEGLTRPTKQGGPPVLLRRMKDDHLEGLPAKEEHVDEEQMPEVQATAYRQAVQTGRGDANPGAMLKTLHALRSVSLHPFHLPDGGSDEDYVAQSARLARAIGQLDRIHERQEKALVFLESLDMQGYLSVLIQRRYRLPEPPMIINGQVSGPARQERVNRFQSRFGFDVLILSPRAGGVGITLTAANHVIHLSRWWNPAVEHQCTDRVYRIGQDKKVFVYLPQARHPEYGEHSFDARLHELLGRKRVLSRSMLAPPGGTD